MTGEFMRGAVGGCALILVSSAGLAPSAVAGGGCWNAAYGFSDVQGSNDWWYGYWESPANDFTLMEEYGVASDNWWSIDFLGPAPSYWTLIGPATMHPNGAALNAGKTPVEQQAILRWVSPVTDTVTCAGHVSCFDVGGDGAEWIIRFNGEEVFSQLIGGFDTVGFGYSLQFTVEPGDTIDFAVATPTGNALYDSTAYSAIIRSITLAGSADLDENCIVDGADLGLLLGAWGTKGSFADLNGDGVVDGADLGQLLAAWTP